MGSIINTDEASLACLLLTSCCAAWFLTGHGPVLIRVLRVWILALEDVLQMFLCVHLCPCPTLLTLAVLSMIS